MFYQFQDEVTTVDIEDIDLSLIHILTYAIPRRDVKPVAKALLERFGSLEKVLSASSRQLCAVSGIGPVSYTHLDVYKRQIIRRSLFEKRI